MSRRPAFGGLRRTSTLAAPLCAGLLLLAPRGAVGAPVGDPVPDPDIGRLRVAGVVDVDAVAAVDVDCVTEDGCAAIDRRLSTGAEVQVAIAQGFGLLGTVGRVRSTVDEADFQAAGWAVGVAAKGGVALNPVWSAFAQVRLDHARPEDSGPGGEKGRQTALTGTLGLSWGAIDSGFAGFVGVQGAPLWADSLWTMGEDGVRIDLASRFPAGGVAGLSFASEPLGASWSRSPRAVVLLEGRVGQSTGAGLSLGVAY